MKSEILAFSTSAAIGHMAGSEVAAGVMMGVVLILAVKALYQHWKGPYHAKY